MKIGEALNEVADCGKKITNVLAMISENSLVAKGESPSTTVETLLLELQALLTRRASLKFLIQKTNMNIVLPDCNGMSLAEYLLEAKRFADMASHINSVINNSKPNMYGMRSKQSEIIIERSFNVDDLKREANAFSKNAREMNDKIQQVNWTTDLLD